MTQRENNTKAVTAPTYAPWLQDRRVVLICGVSGSGKTTLAHRLEAEGYRRISADEIAWRRHGAALANMPAEMKRDAYLHAAAELEEELAGILAVDDGCKVVVDATLCKRAKRDSIRDVCMRAGIDPLLIYLDVPAGELRRRLSQRKGSGPDDQLVSEKELESYVRNFEVPASDEPHILYN